MDASTIWKFLHIAAMFVAVSIFVGQGMLSGAVGRRATSAPSAGSWRRRIDSPPSAVGCSCSASCSGSSPPSRAISI
jgi:hypothetical protein